MVELKPLNGQQVRYVIIDDLPYYDAGDIANACGGFLPTSPPESIIDRVGPHRSRSGAIPSHDGNPTGLVLSPIGAWTISFYGDWHKMLAVEEWVFGETVRIRPDAFDVSKHGIAQTLSLLPGCTLPLQPHSRSKYMHLYYELKQQWAETQKASKARAVAEKPASEQTDLAPDLAQGIQPLNGQKIPFVIIYGLPHYCAGSIAKALDIDVENTLAERVADAHMRVAPIPTADGGVVEGVVLTPIAVWTLGLYQAARQCMTTQMWAFRETKRLRPDAFDRAIHGARVMMALRPDGNVPPRPHPRSGRQDEWLDLQMSPQYRNPHSVMGALRLRKNGS